MQYNSGDIVWLKDGGNEEYLIVLTKENMEHQDLLKDSDYVIKSVLTDEIKYVSKEAIYKAVG